MFIKKLKNGNEIHSARASGGRAGKGHNKTSTIQLRTPHGVILKTKRYLVSGGLAAKAEAVKYLSENFF